MFSTLCPKPALTIAALAVALGATNAHAATAVAQYEFTDATNLSQVSDLSGANRTLIPLSAGPGVLSTDVPLGAPVGARSLELCCDPTITSSGEGLTTIWGPGNTASITPAEILAAGGVTFDAWAKFSVQQGDARIITNGNFDMLTIAGNLARFDLGAAIAITAPAPNDDQWHHYRGVLDLANTTVTLYIDGNIVAQDTNYAGPYGYNGGDPNRGVSVGGSGFHTNPFIGNVYNPAIYLGVVPEPASLVLMGSGALLLVRRRR